MLWLISLVLTGVFGLDEPFREYVLDHPPSDTECFSIEFTVINRARLYLTYAKDQGPRKAFGENLLELQLQFPNGNLIVGYTNKQGWLGILPELYDLDGNPIGNTIGLNLTENQRIRVSLRTRNGNFVFNVQQVNSTRITEGLSVQIPIRDGTNPINYFYILTSDLEDLMKRSDPIVSPCERPQTTPIPVSTTERPSTTSIAPSTTTTTPNQHGCKMTNLTEKDNSLELPVKLCENCVIDVNGILKKGASHLQVLLSLAKGCGEERKDSDDSLDIYHNFIGKKEVIIRQRKDEKFVDPIIKAYQILRPCYRFHIRISVTKDNKYQIVWVDRRDETSYDPIQVPISQVKYINVCGETKDISISLQCS